MGRARAARIRNLMLALAGAAGLVYLACSNAASPSGAPPGDGGGALDGSAGLQDGPLATFDVDLIPPPSDATGGGLCTTAADCPSGFLCLYPVAEGCAAHGVCETIDGSCGGPYCTCRGDSTGVCGDFGYRPMEAPLHAPPCVAFDADGGADSGAAEAGHD